MRTDDDATRARSARGNLGYLFRLAHQAFRAALTDALAPHRLSVPQYGVLSAFDAAPELSSADLARRAAVTPQTMNTLVHQLAQRGLLDRKPHPNHGKVITLRLSADGRRLLDQATPSVRAVEDQALGGLDQHSTDIVKNWLADVITEISAVSADAGRIRSHRDQALHGIG